MTRQAYVLHDCRLAVFWAPKAACTTIANAISDQVIGIAPIWKRPAKRSRLKLIAKEAVYVGEKLLVSRRRRLAGTGPPLRREWLRSEGYHFPGVDALELCRQQGYSSIALLREPYERLVSAYVSKFVQRRGLWLTSPDLLEAFSHAALADFSERRGVPLDPSRGWTFREFVEYVCERIDDPATADGSIDKHWNTQVPPYFADFAYDYLYSTAQSELFFAKLGELTGKCITPATFNQTRLPQGQADTRPGDLVDVPSFELARSRCVDVNAMVDAELQRGVRRSFDIDYRFLDSNQADRRAV